MYYSNEFIFFPHGVTFVVNNLQFYNHMTSTIFPRNFLLLSYIFLTDD